MFSKLSWPASDQSLSSPHVHVWFGMFSIWLFLEFYSFTSSVLMMNNFSSRIRSYQASSWSPCHLSSLYRYRLHVLVSEYISGCSPVGPHPRMEPCIFLPSFLPHHLISLNCARNRGCPRLPIGAYQCLSLRATAYKGLHLSLIVSIVGLMRLDVDWAATGLYRAAIHPQAIQGYPRFSVGFQGLPWAPNGLRLPCV
ncbi:hypothetical protein F5878DRAFT_374112 [Lentinula raphanica]|uniref:Uncharacterized protein n=1 Tax=Lentinula raphanica TaxID=153919 RepID=A0AA38U8F9_9AGAR|nr:hypothetical protein F5878DRAFT_374112 [Lentinula raphanica]